MNGKKYLKDRTVCKVYYNMNRRKNKNQRPKIINTIQKKPIIKNNFENKSCHRQWIVGKSGYGKSYLLNYIPLKKQGPIFVITKSPNQNPNIKAQVTDEIQPSESFENNTVVFDEMLLSNQESKIDLFFTPGRHQNIDINFVSQTYLQTPKNAICNNFKIFFFI